jgi:hypothetical protein
MKTQHVYFIVTFLLGSLAGWAWTMNWHSKVMQTGLERQSEVQYENGLQRSYGTMVVFARGGTEKDATDKLKERLTAARFYGWQVVGPTKRLGAPYFDDVAFEQIISRFPE